MTTKQPNQPANIGQLHHFLTEKSQANQFSGVVLIQQGATKLFQGAYGYANRSWHIKNEFTTRFRVASISKMFTAVSILQLIEQNQLKLDTPLLDVLDLGPTTFSPQITIHHLLSMTAGIADWFEESGDWEANWAALRRQHPLYNFRRNTDYLPLFIHKPPLNPVGAKHKYSNASYILLGLVIEKLSNLTYFDYVRQHIFTPLGMNDSDFLALDGIYDDVATGYIPIKDEEGTITDWRKNIYVATAEAAADGGASAPLADLLHFSRALRNHTLLTPEMSHTMLTPKVLEYEEKYHGYTWYYGYANIFLLDDNEQIVRWGHTGEEDGISGRLFYYPQQNIDVIILANQSSSAGSIGWHIHDLITQQTQTP